MSLTNYGENWILDYVISGQKYIGLHTLTPGETSPGVEVSGNGYARQPIPFTPPGDGEVTNADLIQFPAATGGWGTISGFGVFDAETGGNIIWYGILTDKVGNPTPKTITIGDIFQIPAADLSLTLD